jgi:hypothetical protein
MGTEWYGFHDGLIREIRAYFEFGRNNSTGLIEFPYAERGYTVLAPTRRRSSRLAAPRSRRAGPRQRDLWSGGLDIFDVYLASLQPFGSADEWVQQP